MATSFASIARRLAELDADEQRYRYAMSVSVAIASGHRLRVARWLYLRHVLARMNARTPFVRTKNAPT